MPGIFQACRQSKGTPPECAPEHLNPMLDQCPISCPADIFINMCMCPPHVDVSVAFCCASGMFTVLHETLCFSVRHICAEPCGSKPSACSFANVSDIGTHCDCVATFKRAQWSLSDNAADTMMAQLAKAKYTLFSCMRSFANVPDIGTHM